MVQVPETLSQPMGRKEERRDTETRRRQEVVHTMATTPRLVFLLNLAMSA